MRDKKESAAASVGQRRRQDKKLFTNIISQGKENVKYESVSFFARGCGRTSVFAAGKFKSRGPHERLCLSWGEDKQGSGRSFRRRRKRRQADFARTTRRERAK